MATDPSQQTLISRLREEINAFQLAGNLSSDHLGCARQLDNWTCVYHPNTYIEICGTVSRGSPAKGELMMVGRVLEVDAEARLVLTTAGAFLLGNRQKSDKANRWESSDGQVKELEAIKVQLEEYRHDLWVASRYMAELTPSMWTL
ncbi:MAG: hypothetical protein MRY81_01090 [Donghicola eburneus]|nr:hypothetical protein [Donghicola eburneus]MCI5038255.1 hypothetical protein [Donghicola eburneus]